MRQFSFSTILFFLSLFCSAQPAKTLRLLKAGEFQKAIELTKEKKDKYKNPIKYHLFLARGYAQTGNDVEAEKEYLSALSLVQKKERKLQLMDYDVIDELSLLRVRTGNWEGAKRLIKWSLATRTAGWNKKNPTNFRPYLPLGILHFSQAQVDSASYYLKTYTKNLRNSNYTSHLDVDKYADAYQTMAEIALNDGDLQTARRYANKSSRLQRHEWTRKEIGKNYPDRVTALNTLTQINLREKKYNRAKTMDRKVSYILKKHLEGHDLLQAEVYLNKAQLAYHTGEMDAAQDHLQKVMELKVDYIKSTYSYLSEYEKENIYPGFKKGNTDVVELSSQLLQEVELADASSFVENLFNFIINTKAVILSESNKIVSATNNSESSLSDQLKIWKDLKREWYYLNAVSKKKSREKENQVQLQIVELEKQLGQQLGIEPAKDWKSIAKNLESNEIAIEFAQLQPNDLSTKFLAFKLERDAQSPEVFVLESSIPKEKYISYYNNAIRFGQEDTLSYSLFWEPLKISQEIKKIYLSPSGFLHQVNFNTLQNSEQVFVSDNYTIVDISNTGNLTKGTNEDSPFKSATLVGISDFELNNKYIKELALDSLPGVSEEVEKIVSILDANDVSTFTFFNKEAKESTLTEHAIGSILHLSTHGLFDTRASNPMLGSGLVFSITDESEDGILTAYEASLLNLEETELVVLSACASGLGGIVDGEGVYGLQRAFEVAGVKNIIMSLWNIDDQFTQYFMSSFYSTLMETKDVPTAFQQTLKKAKETNPNPRFWGAFKLVQFF